MGLLGINDRSVGGEGVVGSANLAVVECLHMLMIGFCGSWDRCRENFAGHEAANSLYTSRCCNIYPEVDLDMYISTPKTEN